LEEALQQMPLYSKFLKDVVTRKLEITMPFEEALQQMPLYSKFLKDMVTRKHKYIHQENIIVEGDCSAVIQKILPPKHKDPGSLTIPYSIGDVTVGKLLLTWEPALI